jgi:hypothetical protein
MSLVVAPGTPYVVPSVLVSAPTGISWSSIGGGRGSTPQQQNAEQLNLCVRATAMIDAYCGMPLRATVDTETLSGPDGYRVSIRPNGTARLMLSRSPVVKVLSGQVSSAAAFPPQWRAIAADQWAPEKPLIGVYGTSAPASAGEGSQAVLLAPGWLSWRAGRYGSLIQVTYINGWPHGSLAQDVAAAASSLSVDDVTGWLGAAGIIHDGGSQEAISVTAVTPSTVGALSGPGTLTLASPLVSAHRSGTMVSALPGTVVWAGILFCVSQALTRGATATTVQSQPGSAGGGGRTPEEYAAEAELWVHSLKLTL